MAWRPHGRAKVSVGNQESWAVCDACGFWYNHSDLKWQFDWRGPRLMNMRQLVCKRCNDKPQEQLRPRILPPDPTPTINPRPEHFVQNNGLQGFTYYQLWTNENSPSSLSAVVDQNNKIVTDQTGTPIVVPQGFGPLTMLAEIAYLSGIPVPIPHTDRSTSTVAASVSQTLMAANATRSWMVIFNPSSFPIAISISGAAKLGVAPSILIGLGGALFWATAQGGQAATKNVVTVAGPVAGIPIWAFEA